MKYAGVGSRQTPTDILIEFYEIGKLFGSQNILLRSGGANGADAAFEKGCIEVNGPKEIFLPFKGFNGNASLLYKVSKAALKLAESVHPAWHNCDWKARNFHARNCYQILGANLDDPVNFVVCWTFKGNTVGGTATAINLAKRYQIPVFNFAIPAQREAYYERFS